MPSIKALFRYPVKGLSGEALESVTLQPGRSFPDDRRFAIAHGEAAIDAERPRWMPKRAFIALDTLPGLASLSSAWDAQTGRLEIRSQGEVVASGDLRDHGARLMLERFFTDFAGRAARGGARIVEAFDFSFADAQAPLVSIISHGSLAALASAPGRAIDARRLRANIELDSALAWAENTWVGQTLEIGAVRLRVLEPILRCAATCANPDSGAVDLNLPRLLARSQGEALFGVYAEVVGGGILRPGAEVQVSSG